MGMCGGHLQEGFAAAAKKLGKCEFCGREKTVFHQTFKYLNPPDSSPYKSRYKKPCTVCTDYIYDLKTGTKIKTTWVKYIVES